MVWRATIDHGDGEAVDHGGDLGAGKEAEDSTQGCRVRGAELLRREKKGSNRPKREVRNSRRGLKMDSVSYLLRLR